MDLFFFFFFLATGGWEEAMKEITPVFRELLELSWHFKIEISDVWSVNSDEFAFDERTFVYLKFSCGSCTIVEYLLFLFISFY